MVKILKLDMKKLLLLFSLLIFTLSFANAQKRFVLDLSGSYIVNNPNPIDTVIKGQSKPILIALNFKNLGTFKGKGNPYDSASFTGGTYKINYLIASKVDFPPKSISLTQTFSLSGLAWLGNETVFDSIFVDSRFIPDTTNIVIIWPTGDAVGKSNDSLDTAQHQEFKVFVKTKKAGVSGIELFVSKNFKIYPNPVKDVLNIEMNAAGKGTLVLTDVTGKIIATKPFETTKSGNVSLQLNNDSVLPDGIYFVKVETSSYTETSKILISK